MSFIDKIEQSKLKYSKCENCQELIKIMNEIIKENTND